MIFRQERSNHSVLRNFWHKETVRGMTAASPWGAGSFFRTRGTSEEAAKKAGKGVSETRERHRSAQPRDGEG